MSQSDQEQAPLDLAVMEAMGKAIVNAWLIPDDLPAYQTIGLRVLALVTALKAAQREIELCDNPNLHREIQAWDEQRRQLRDDLTTAQQEANNVEQAYLEYREDHAAFCHEALRRAEAELRQARDDLARVEAERNDFHDELHAMNRDDGLVMEQLQARNAELEAAVDMTPDYLGRTKLTYATEVIGLRKDLAIERKRIAELEGSLRPFSEAARTIDSWGVVVDDDLDLILLDESEVGLTVADLRRARANLPPQTTAAS